MGDTSIILMGIKHSGKTTQGRLLSAHFSLPFFDTDDEITAREGLTPREIYTKRGKDAFMAAEAAACTALARAQVGARCVVATGGGICTNPAAVAALRPLGTFVFLNADEMTACDRIIKEIVIEQDGILQNLPAYIAREKPRTIDDVRRSFHNFYTERQELYRSICDIAVDMLPVSKAENTEMILRALGNPQTA